MKLITFVGPDGGRHYGADLGAAVLGLDVALHFVPPFDSPAGSLAVPRTLQGLIAAGRTGLDAAREAVRRVDEADDPVSTARLPRSEVRLLAPLPAPTQILAIGRNYRDHASEAAAKLPAMPRIFPKFASTVIGDNQPILRPQATQQLDWEVELGVVIGRPATRVAESDALAYVAGYTLINDVSARDIQFSTPEQLTLAKNYRTFTPMGPCIVTTDEVPDPGDIPLKLWVNDELMQDSSTKYLIFSVPYLVSFASHVLDLGPGDVISTGTPSGVGHFRTPPRYLVGGDVVKMRLGDICSLTNPVRDDA